MGESPLFSFREDMGTTEEDIRALAERLAGSAGFSVLDVETRRRGASWLIVVVIDKPGGVTADDCAYLSEEMRPRLVGLGLVEGEFRLRVSSPGLDRALRKEADFVWAVGRLAKVVTRHPVEGKTSHVGRIEGVAGGTVLVNCGPGAVRRLALGDIQSARLEVELR